MNSGNYNRHYADLDLLDETPEAAEAKRQARIERVRVILNCQPQPKEKS